MDLFDVTRACFRRWYVVLPLLLASAWFAHTAYTTTKPVYYTNAVVGIAPPNAQTVYAPEGGVLPRNGLLDAGGAALLTNMATFAMRDAAAVGQVVAAGGEPDYTVKMFPGPATSPQLPLIMIEATESDPISAAKTVELAAGQAGPALRKLQQDAGVPDEQMVKALIVSPPRPPVAAVPSRTRATAAIFAAGTGGAIIAGVVTELAAARWKSRRARSRNRNRSTEAAAMRNSRDPKAQTVDEQPVAREVSADL